MCRVRLTIAGGARGISSFPSLIEITAFNCNHAESTYGVS